MKNWNRRVLMRAIRGIRDYWSDPCALPREWGVSSRTVKGAGSRAHIPFCWFPLPVVAVEQGTVTGFLPMDGLSFPT